MPTGSSSAAGASTYAIGHAGVFPLMNRPVSQIERLRPHEHSLDPAVPPVPIMTEDGEMAVLVRCAECGIGGRVILDVCDVDWGEWR